MRAFGTRLSFCLHSRTSPRRRPHFPRPCTSESLRPSSRPPVQRRLAARGRAARARAPFERPRPLARPLRPFTRARGIFASSSQPAPVRGPRVRASVAPATGRRARSVENSTSARTQSAAPRRSLDPTRLEPGNRVSPRSCLGALCGVGWGSAGDGRPHNAPRAGEAQPSTGSAHARASGLSHAFEPGLGRVGLASVLKRKLDGSEGRSDAWLDRRASNRSRRGRPPRRVQGQRTVAGAGRLDLACQSACACFLRQDERSGASRLNTEIGRAHV